jgi:hypothetical protein
MSAENKNHILVEENNIPIASGNKGKKDKDKDKKIPLIKQNGTDKNDIIIELSNHKKEEEDEKSANSAEFSGQNLKNENMIQNENIEKEKAKTARQIKPIILSQKAYDKYTQRLKERTMRMEIEKMDKETERIKQKYEEKNAFLHLFDNNPLFQKMLKYVEKQLILICILGMTICIYSGLLYFYISNSKMGLALANFFLSISEISIFFILIITLKSGLLNDPNLSKAFRLFVFAEFLTLVGSLVINILIPIYIKKYLKKVDKTSRIIIYILFLLVILLFIITLKYCLTLFVESILILLNKKTEYSILMINEQNSKSELNIISNLQTSHNMSTEGLINTSNGIISNNEKNTQNNMVINKEEEQYKKFNYFNKFHYSVTSNRNDENYFNKK